MTRPVASPMTGERWKPYPAYKDSLKEYRTALISAAVTGKIDVRGGDTAGGVWA